MNKGVKDKLDYISDLLGAEVDPQNPDEMLAKLNTLISNAGYVAGLVAETEQAYKYALLEAYKQTVEDKPPSTVHGKVLESMVASESAAHTYADKINASLKLAVEGLRTMISLYKTEAENSVR